jgi:hypothetical protein
LAYQGNIRESDTELWDSPGQDKTRSCKINKNYAKKEHNNLHGYLIKMENVILFIDMSSEKPGEKSYLKKYFSGYTRNDFLLYNTFVRSLSGYNSVYREVTVSDANVTEP